MSSKHNHKNMDTGPHNVNDSEIEGKEGKYENAHDFLHSETIRSTDVQSESIKTNLTNGKESEFERQKRYLPMIHARDEILFDMLKTEEDAVMVNDILLTFKRAGLRKTDPRLRKTMLQFQALKKGRILASKNRYDSRNVAIQQARAYQRVSMMTLFASQALDRETFIRCIADGELLISNAVRGQFVITDWAAFREQIQEIYSNCKLNTKGSLPTYIPQLQRVNPELWGVSICTIDGQRVSWGDAWSTVPLQSVSKVFNYAIVLNDRGSEFVHKVVGQEPSGTSFNDIRLNDKGLPHNPMVNAGAIVVCDLIKNDRPMSDAFDYVFETYKKLAGGEHIGFSNITFLSERENADRNYSVVYYMRENKAIRKNRNVKELLDFYLQLCSIEITCDSASVMAATLDVLSLMYGCGMYDYSGQFAFHVGLPAKSGISGVLLVVVPNVMGIALWSPLVDQHGNSVRGVQFCKELVERFNFHNFESLLHKGTKINPRRGKESHLMEEKVICMLYSAAQGDLDTLKRYVLDGVDANYPDYDGRTALHMAASEGQMEVMQFLLSRCNMDPVPLDRWGFTPLDNCYYFHHFVCARLIEEVVYPNGIPLDVQTRCKRMKEGRREAFDDFTMDPLLNTFEEHEDATTTTPKGDFSRSSGFG